MVSRIQALHVSLIDSFPLFAAAVISNYWVYLEIYGNTIIVIKKKNFFWY